MIDWPLWANIAKAEYGLNVGEWEWVSLEPYYVIETTREDLPVQVQLTGADSDEVLRMASRLEVEL